MIRTDDFEFYLYWLEHRGLNKMSAILQDILNKFSLVHKCSLLFKFKWS